MYFLKFTTSLSPSLAEVFNHFKQYKGQSVKGIPIYNRTKYRYSVGVSSVGSRCWTNCSNIRIAICIKCKHIHQHYLHNDICLLDWKIGGGENNVGSANTRSFLYYFALKSIVVVNTFVLISRLKSSSEFRRDNILIVLLEVQ